MVTEKDIKILKNKGWRVGNFSPTRKSVEYSTSNGFTCQIIIHDSESLLDAVRKEYEDFDEQRYVKEWQYWSRVRPSRWHPKSELELSASEQKQALKELFEALTTTA